MNRMKPDNCLGCGKLVDAATSFADPAAKPSPGDITICLDCGHVMAFADDLKLRSLTDQELIEIAADPEILALQRARGMA